ncbi:MAG: pyrroline-5-carboxylate reductase [Clostridiales bacterium]|nr:pyrroline-5-carboxylate reductase [Clostridiales bacterium]
MNIGFIGMGNLAAAILKGILQSNILNARSIYAYDIDAKKLTLSAHKLGYNAASSSKELVSKCDMIFLAVKPADLPQLLQEIKSELKAKRPVLVSTAAGTSSDFIQKQLGYDAALVRIMPNINATIGRSMTAYCSNSRVSDEQAGMVEKILSTFGKVMKLEEEYFSMFTAIAGSGPAFAYMFIDELARAGVKIGLNKDLALEIAAQTVLGSAKLILESKQHPYELIDNVCSPGGTTIEGVSVLRELGFANAVSKAVEHTYEKDIRLSEKNKEV